MSRFSEAADDSGESGRRGKDSSGETATPTFSAITCRKARRKRLGVPTGDLLFPTTPGNGIVISTFLLGGVIAHNRPQRVCPVQTGTSDRNVRGIVRLAIIATVAFGATLSSHSPAQASCGDYVHLGMGSVHQSPTATLAESVVGRPLPDHPTPCRGPNCSRRPEHVPLLPVSLSPPTIAQDACVLQSAAIPTAGAESHLTDHSSPDPITRPFRLDRPPRH